LENETVKYGCIQSLDLLEPDLQKKVSQAMTHKFSAYLPRSVVKNSSE
jgi:uncharacterized protein YijF (DUF1287 family)